MPKYQKDGRKKIAIIQGGAWGDNINSTLMLHPLKQHFDDPIIDIHTSDLYSSAFYNNPHINNIIQYKCQDKNHAISLAKSIPSKLQDSNYDIISAPHPMYHPGDWSSIKHPEWGENLIFSWVRAIENLGISCDNPETILKLTNEEVAKTTDLMSIIPKNRKNVLMEIHGESGQTPWNHHWTIAVGEYLCQNNCNLLISHKERRDDILHLYNKYKSQVYWIGNLSIRECAEVYNRSDLFISVSSGLSNACNTNWCKNRPQWLEVVNSITCSSAAIRKEGKKFWHGNLNGFIELLKNLKLREYFSFMLFNLDHKIYHLHIV